MDLHLSHELPTDFLLASLDQLPFGIYIIQGQSNEVLYCNRFAKEKFGRLPLITQAIENSDVDNRFLKNGHWYEVSEQVVDWKNTNSKLLVIKDVSSSIHHESLSQRIDKDLENLLSLLPVALILTNSNHQIVKLNKQALELFEYTKPEQIEGLPIEKILDLEPVSENKVDTHIGTDVLRRYRLTTRAGHTRYVLHQFNSTVFTNQRLFLYSFINISELVQDVEDAKSSSEAKSRFLANMSHEIRTPLNGITGMADVMVHAENLPPEHYEYAGIIKKSSDLLLSIINDILDFSKIEAGKMTLEEIPFNLREEVHFTINALQFNAKEKNLPLIVQFKDDVPDKVIGDPFRLRQVITNLVGNAIKFTEKGKIIISVEFVRDLYGTFIILFQVADTGIGIRQEKLNRIFSLYSQADLSTTRKYGGTGLGTTIAKQLVEMMEGEIWAESPSGISDNPKKYPGAKFSFTVELYSDEKIDKNIAYDAVKNLSDLKTLFVDNRDFKKAGHLFRNFQNIGIPCERVTNKEDALNILKFEYMPSERHKVVIVEDNLEFDGMELVSLFDDYDITEKYIVFILSSNDRPGNYAKSKRIRADHYIVKPYDPKEIFNSIQEHFDNLTFESLNIGKHESILKEIKILVAEDNTLNQKVAKTVFKSLGYEIDIAENGSIVLSRIKQQKYDAVFMDFFMPVKDGLEATRELRKKGYTMPVIAMTGNATESDRKKAMEAGMNDFLAKPILLSTVKNLLMKWFPEN